jgi:hypothetical protein
MTTSSRKAFGETKNVNLKVTDLWNYKNQIYLKVEERLGQMEE